MTRSEAPATTSYKLSAAVLHGGDATIASALRRLAPLMAGERRMVTQALVAVVITSISSLLAPVIISHTIDTYIQRRNFGGVVRFSAILLAVYVVGLFSTYFQTQ